MPTQVKICGVTTPEALAAATDAGAAFIGLVFHPKSPRHLDLPQAAALARQSRPTTVGLFVDPDNDTLTRTLAAVPLKMIQLHGHETVTRVAEVKSITGLPVIKAIPVADEDDVMRADLYARVADWLLFDAKIPGAVLPGGMGRNFDWQLLKNYRGARPWMLAGGLTPDNIAAALQILKPDAVDVSSGVESSPGVKDAGKIASFVANLRHAQK